MLNKFPVASLGITVAVMAADGLVASYDIDQNNKKNAGVTGYVPGTSPALLKSKAIWLQGGALALGVIGEVAGWHPDYTEPLMLSGAGLMAREAAVHFAQARQTTPASVQGYSAPVAAPAWRRPVTALARPAVNAGGPGQRQVVTSAG